MINNIQLSGAQFTSPVPSTFTREEIQIRGDDGFISHSYFDFGGNPKTVTNTANTAMPAQNRLMSVTHNK